MVSGRGREREHITLSSPCWPVDCVPKWPAQCGFSAHLGEDTDWVRCMPRPLDLCLSVHSTLLPGAWGALLGS